LERKNGKLRPRIGYSGGNAKRRPRLDMGCSAVEEEEEEGEEQKNKDM
jgi:hypothetical protein